MSINLRLQEYRSQKSTGLNRSSVWKILLERWHKFRNVTFSFARERFRKTAGQVEITELVGEEEPEPPVPNAKLRWTIFILKALIWILLMVLFVHIEFGAVFFVCSSLYFIVSSLRNIPRKPGELSAYSVFNPNCESIDGTLKAEQFESELRYGALHQH